jgi:hypothetical protein
MFFTIPRPQNLNDKNLRKRLRSPSDLVNSSPKIRKLNKSGRHRFGTNFKLSIKQSLPKERVIPITFVDKSEKTIENSEDDKESNESIMKT